MSSGEAARAAEHVARDSYGRLVAFLAVRTRDVAGAEDALGEAFASALETWPRDGVPRNPDAWLLTVARRRQTDAIRRRQTRAAGEDHLRLIADEIEAAAGETVAIPDRRLALMFACAHPDIEPAMRAPLILQTVLGLSAIDIAAVFLIPPATMGQRLVRAKNRIREAGIPFAIPDHAELPGRLDGVLDAVYAAYAKGWSELGETDGTGLAEEAVWLARLLVALLPDQPEAQGMLALMLYTSSRAAARRSADDSYVPLDEQDTDLWDRERIDAAETLLREASAHGPSGRYQLEAAIQSAHVARRLVGADTWPAILALYTHLLELTRSPVVALNRAAVLARIEGPYAALDALAPLAEDRRMLSYQPWWATRAHILAEAGHREAAREAYSVAIGLATDSAARTWLQHRLAALSDG